MPYSIRSYFPTPYWESSALISPFSLIQRFTEALLNNELAEASNKSLSADLQEMRDSFSHLSTEHARSVGWEARLRQAMQERDDFHQERDNAAQKLRASEVKSISLDDKCGESCSYNRTFPP
jgi:hypothetical protein